MKVDMSVEAVTSRLRAMDELWLLSIKLMSARSGSSVLRSRGASRALEICDSIRSVLYDHWDPIGIQSENWPTDEYDAYLAPVYRILVGSRSESELIECLRKIERDEMGVGPAPATKLVPVAKRLLSLDVSLNVDPIAPKEAGSASAPTETR